MDYSWLKKIITVSFLGKQTRKAAVCHLPKGARREKINAHGRRNP
jgi:hypothetical protein